MYVIAAGVDPAMPPSTTAHHQAFYPQYKTREAVPKPDDLLAS